MAIKLDEAMAFLTQCREAATQEGMNLCFVIVDESGLPVALTRMDGCFPGATEAAQAKARCAMYFRRPSKTFSEAHKEGRPVAHLPNVMPLGGGVLLQRNGEVVAAMGVSGSVEATESDLADKLAEMFA